MPDPAPVPAPAYSLTPGDILKILKVAADSLVKNGVIGADGHFVKDGVFLEAEDVAFVVADVEAAYVADGGTIPPKIAQVLQALPALLSLLASTLG